MGDISEVLQKYSADERFISHKELLQIARGAVGLAEENDRLRAEVERLKRELEMSDSEGSPVGWTVVSMTPNSVLCQSKTGARRRYFFPAKNDSEEE